MARRLAPLRGRCWRTSGARAGRRGVGWACWSPQVWPGARIGRDAAAPQGINTYAACAGSGGEPLLHRDGRDAPELAQAGGDECSAERQGMADGRPGPLMSMQRGWSEPLPFESVQSSPRVSRKKISKFIDSYRFDIASQTLIKPPVIVA